MALQYNANLEVQYSPETLLGQVDRDTLSLLKSVWSEARYESGQLILDAEDGTNDVLFLLEGKVRVANFSAKGREVSFMTMDEGNCFGEFAVIDGAPRSASVVALDSCKIAHIKEATFKDLLETHSDISLALMRSLVARLRELTRRVSDFNAMKADDRIRLELIRMCEAHVKPDGSVEIERPPTQSELAAFVFTNREAVAREIGRMKRKGLISRQGRGLIVPSLDSLRAYQEACRSASE